MKGIIAWFARNDVAANLLMLTIFATGLYALFFRSTLEVFPEFELDTVTVSVPYRGATPTEVEEGVIIKIEEAIQDLNGIDEIQSFAAEGAGRVQIEVADGYDSRELLDEVKNRVDSINTFPGETERPTYEVLQRRQEVISVAVSGELPERELRVLGERVREELTSLPGITLAELQETRPYEVSIEVSESTLEAYDLTFDELTQAIRRSSLDLPAGTIKTRGGEILLRTKGQAYTREQFEEIVVRSRADGVHLTLGELATIHDGFEEEPLVARFNGRPCVMIEVYRVGDQNAITLSNTVKDYLVEARERMPVGVHLDYWRDRAKIIKARLNTLMSSAIQGGILVVLLLALFLRLTVAFWVTIGIPLTFAGAIALMPAMGVTFNVVSMFAFILVLGIVVDDAIVTGENIFVRLKEGGDSTEAVIAGTREVALPVTFGVLTTVIAFIPLLMMGGIRGKIFAQIPMIVIPVMLFSLVESKLILPAHLKHISCDPSKQGLLTRGQQRLSDGFMWLVRTFYQPVLVQALRQRYLTVALFVAVGVVVVCMVISGSVRFVFFPRIPSETATATLTMPQGTPFEITQTYVDRMLRAAEQVRDKYRDPETGESVILDILSTAGSTGGSRGQSHLGRVRFEIQPPEQRATRITSPELVQEWRELIGVLPGAQELSFRAEIGRGGDPIDIRLVGDNFVELATVAQSLKARLTDFGEVFGITDTYQDGKEEIKLQIRPRAEVLGLTMSDLARQVRQAFFGAEAQRIQRGRDDVRVMVRYPRDDRDSIGNLEQMKIRAGSGAAVPFSEVAEVEMGRGFATIRRVDRKRVINVRADANKKTANIPAIIDELSQHLDKVTAQYPSVRYAFEGEEEERRDSLIKLRVGLVLLLFAIYAMLAIPLRSYIQPLIAMAVIPFGLLGGILGHMIMGLDLSIFSIFGMLALIGVVVNDSLVLIDFVNRYRAEGKTLYEAVSTGGTNRFRAILLTSLTTFAGLMPLIFDKSTQAQFLIPMAVSLGFGILFATLVTLFLVPTTYLILEDLLHIGRKVKYACWG